MTTQPIAPYICRCGGIMNRVLVGRGIPEIGEGKAVICGQCLFVSVFTKELTLAPATLQQMTNLVSQESFLKNLLRLQKGRRWVLPRLYCGQRLWPVIG